VKRIRESQRDDWWRPYVGVLLLALASAVLVMLFLLANYDEISRALRQAGP
jgi:hypothetical protein